MSAHTPAPWAWCYPSLDEDIPALVTKDDDTTMTSTVLAEMGDLQTPEEQVANARLIVRAVNSHDELVAALTAAKAALDFCIPELERRGVFCHPDGTAKSALKRIDAALAKAGGTDA